MKPHRVAVLMGGMSGERDVSLATGEAVVAALCDRGHDAFPLDAGRDVAEQLAVSAPEVAWVALHGTYGEDGCIQGLLEVLGIPYTGSGVFASALCMDKWRTKQFVRHLPGVCVAADQRLGPNAPVPDDVRFPVVVKPVDGGSSLGVSIVEAAAHLPEAVRQARRHGSEVMVEAHVSGPEIAVALLDGEPFPPVEIVPDGAFYDYAAKYESNGTRYRVPATVSDEARLRASNAAVDVAAHLGCEGLCRVDFIVGADQQPVLIEVNTSPGMTASSLVPMAASAAGLCFEEIVERALASAFRAKHRARTVAGDT